MCLLIHLFRVPREKQSENDTVSELNKRPKGVLPTSVYGRGSMSIFGV